MQRRKMKLSILHINIVFVYGFGLFASEAFGWECLSPVAETYCKAGTACAIRFNISSYFRRTSVFSIVFYNGKLQANIFYRNGHIDVDTLPGTNLTADESGSINLTFLRVNLSNAGTYRLDLIDSNVPCVTLYILGKPTEPIISSNSVPVEGGNVTLTCTSNSGTVPTNHSLTMSYNWRVHLRSVDYPENSRFTYTQSNKSLIVSDIKKEDSNLMFSCMATESAGGLSSSWSNADSFDVIYAPEVFIRVSRSSVSQGVPVALFCEATGIPAMYNYEGFQQSFNGKVINRRYKSVAGTQENSSLFLLSPQLQDTGTYTCFVNNGISKNGSLFQKGSIRLKVTGTPLFLTNKTHFYGTPGENLVIILPFYSYSEYTNVTFIREDSLVIRSSNTYIISITNSSTLVTTKFYTTDVSLNASIINMTILNVSAEHFGQYSVNIFNSFGGNAFIFTAIATGPPLPPTDLTAHTLYSTYSGGLFLIWKRSSDRGSEQTFLVQTSTDGESWTNQTTVQESDHRQLLCASAERYFAILTDLQAGLYRCRLITWNEFGYADTVYWQNPVRVSESVDRCGCNLFNYSSYNVVIGMIIGASNLLCMIVATFLAKYYIKRSHATKKKGRLQLMEQRRYKRGEKNRHSCNFVANSDMKCGSSAKCIQNTCTQSATTSYADISYKDSDMSSSTAPYSSLEDHLRSEPGAYDVTTSTNAALNLKT